MLTSACPHRKFVLARIDQAVLHPRPQEVDVFLAMDEHGAGVRGRSGATRPLAWTSGNVSPADTPGSGPGDQQLKQTLAVFCAGFDVAVPTLMRRRCRFSKSDVPGSIAGHVSIDMRFYRFDLCCYRRDPDSLPDLCVREVSFARFLRSCGIVALRSYKIYLVYLCLGVSLRPCLLAEREIPRSEHN